MDRLNSNRFRTQFLWFDELIMQSPRADIVGSIVSAAMKSNNIPPTVIDEFQRFFSPVQKYVPRYRFCNDFEKLWEKDKALSEQVGQTFRQYFARQFAPVPSDPTERRYWEYDLSRDTGASSIVLLDALNLLPRLGPENCYLLPSKAENVTLTRINKTTGPNDDFYAFSEVIKFKIPNLRSLPWEKIVKYRQNEFLVDFRAVMPEIRREITKGNVGSIKEVLSEMQTRYVREMLPLFKPSLKVAVLKGIVTNIPLPIPVSPFGIYESLKDVKRQRDFKRKFGWLYFLYDIG